MVSTSGTGMAAGNDVNIVAAVGYACPLQDSLYDNQAPRENKMKDVKDIILSGTLTPGTLVSISGWLVDRPEGLFILGDHFPEDYDFPYKLRLVNGNIMYVIIRFVPRLGGGRSSLFYRSAITGKVTDEGEIHATGLSVQADRSKEEMLELVISEKSVSHWVTQFGDYSFDHLRNVSGDWMDAYLE